MLRSPNYSVKPGLHVRAASRDNLARIYCSTHLPKCTVQGVAGKKDGDAGFFLDVAALRSVARELEHEKPEWYQLPRPRRTSAREDHGHHAVAGGCDKSHL